MTAADADTNWHRWGEDDERGALNFLTPEVVLAAARTCRVGRVYHLGLPIQKNGMPGLDRRGAPQRLTVSNLAGQPAHMSSVAPAEVGSNEEVLIMNSHTLTHMDALCHVYAGNRIYNGFEAATFETNAGATRCGIETVKGIVGRAILLDVAAYKGVAWLEEGDLRITGADLEACAAAEGVSPRTGDILLVRTGYLDMFFALSGQPRPVGQPGIDLSAVAYIADNQFAAVGADNAAVEMIPFDQGRFISVHIELLVKRGIPLLENLNLHEMGADKVFESLFVVAPLLITGASGSPINPLAIA